MLYLRFDPKKKKIYLEADFFCRKEENICGISGFVTTHKNPAELIINSVDGKGNIEKNIDSGFGELGFDGNFCVVLLHNNKLIVVKHGFFPLFLRAEKDMVVFSSHPKNLGQLKPSINSVPYFISSKFSYDLELFEGIKYVKPYSIIYFEDGKIMERVFFDLDRLFLGKMKDEMSYQEKCSKISQTVLRGITFLLENSTFSVGGIDSSILLSVFRKTKLMIPKAYHLVFQGAEETKYIDSLENYLGISIERIYPDKPNPFYYIEEMVKKTFLPFAGVQYPFFKMILDKEKNWVLGTGADNLFRLQRQASLSRKLKRKLRKYLSNISHKFLLEIDRIRGKILKDVPYEQDNDNKGNIPFPPDFSIIYDTNYLCGKSFHPYLQRSLLEIYPFLCEHDLLPFKKILRDSFSAFLPRDIYERTDKVSMGDFIFRSFLSASDADFFKKFFSEGMVVEEFVNMDNLVSATYKLLKGDRRYFQLVFNVFTAEQWLRIFK